MAGIEGLTADAHREQQPRSILDGEASVVAGVCDDADARAAGGVDEPVESRARPLLGRVEPAGAVERGEHAVVEPGQLVVAPRPAAGAESPDRWIDARYGVEHP